MFLDNATKVKFQRHLVLRSDAPYLKHAEHFEMSNERRLFQLRVDPTKLEKGKLYYTEVGDALSHCGNKCVFYKGKIWGRDFGSDKLPNYFFKNMFYFFFKHVYWIELAESCIRMVSLLF